MTAATDAGGAVRRGEELDLAAIEAWLRAEGVDLDGNAEVTQFSGGASNWTYRLKYANRDLILRRPPAGTKARGAHDMAREFAVQQALKPRYPAVPTMVAPVSRCRRHRQRVLRDGTHRRPHPARAPAARGEPRCRQTTRQLCLNVIDKLIELHQVDYRAAGMETLGKWRGLLPTPGRRLERALSARPGPGTCRVSRGCATGCAPTRPTTVATCVIHNDWRFDNVVLEHRTTRPA
jgi:aminoglycoside phosphotransferase (APT) family kinase protein